jgi:hypothetical protein
LPAELRGMPMRTDALIWFRVGWFPIEELPKEHYRYTMLLTNNIRAKDAYGRMSHIWAGFVIESSNPKEDGRFITYTDTDRKVRNLTHCCYIPEKIHED